MAPSGALNNGRLPEGNRLFVNNTSFVSQRLVDAWCSERTQRGELHSCPVCLIAISLRYAFEPVEALMLPFLSDTACNDRRRGGGAVLFQDRPNANSLKNGKNKKGLLGESRFLLVFFSKMWLEAALPSLERPAGNIADHCATSREAKMLTAVLAGTQLSRTTSTNSFQSLQIEPFPQLIALISRRARNSSRERQAAPNVEYPSLHRQMGFDARVQLAAMITVRSRSCHELLRALPKMRTTSNSSKRKTCERHYEGG